MDQLLIAIEQDKIKKSAQYHESKVISWIKGT